MSKFSTVALEIGSRYKQRVENRYVNNVNTNSLSDAFCDHLAV